MTTPEDMEKLFSKWAEAGAVGVKTDYFEGEEQQPGFIQLVSL